MCVVVVQRQADRFNQLHEDQSLSRCHKYNEWNALFSVYAVREVGVLANDGRVDEEVIRVDSVRILWLWRWGSKSKVLGVKHVVVCPTKLLMRQLSVLRDHGDGHVAGLRIGDLSDCR